MKSKKPTHTMPMMPCTLATMSRGKSPEKTDAANPQPASIKLHSSTEPSWLPHTALNL